MNVKENNLVCIGLISRSHGVKGEVLIKSYTQSPRDLGNYFPIKLKSGEHISLSIVGQSKGQFIARIDGIYSRDQSEKLSGELIYVDRGILPRIEDANEYYHTDLIGIRVVTQNRKVFGNISAIYDFGAGDIVEIKKNNKLKIMVPFTKNFFIEVDVTKGEVIVNENLLEKFDEVS